MKDHYGREISYMRISITDRCNLSCKYCSPSHMKDMDTCLHLDDYILAAEAASALGISHIRITGGEPLVSDICIDLIRRLKSIPGIESVTLTTNGVLLKQFADELKKAGIDAVNVSLDTMDRNDFIKLTGADHFEAVIDGIKTASSIGIKTKINTVIRRSTDPCALVSFANMTGSDLRFIEMMPIGYGREFPSIPAESILTTLTKHFGTPEPAAPNNAPFENGPAVYYSFPSLKIRVGVIEAVHGKFCSTCNRIRLTSEGILKPCLAYQSQYDLKELLRSANNKEGLQNLIETAILNKPEGHHFELSDDVMKEIRTMCMIGG